MTKCEFGACKSGVKVEVKMENFATGDKRKSLVCRDHLKTVLDTCCKERIYATFSKLEQRGT